RCGCDFHRGKKQSSDDDDGGSLSRHCFCSLLRLPTAVCSRGAKTTRSDKVDSSSSMCLPFFPMSFQTPQIEHACTELLDKKTNKIRGDEVMKNKEATGSSKQLFIP
ncbi:hypothetical protein HID58_086254, partial [Brassica napus]